LKRKCETDGHTRCQRCQDGNKVCVPDSQLEQRIQARATAGVSGRRWLGTGARAALAKASAASPSSTRGRERTRAASGSPRTTDSVTGGDSGGDETSRDPPRRTSIGTLGSLGPVPQPARQQQPAPSNGQSSFTNLNDVDLYTLALRMRYAAVRAGEPSNYGPPQQQHPHPDGSPNEAGLDLMNSWNPAVGYQALGGLLPSATAGPGSSTGHFSGHSTIQTGQPGLYSTASGMASGMPPLWTTGNIFPDGLSASGSPVPLVGQLLAPIQQQPPPGDGTISPQQLGSIPEMLNEASQNIVHEWGRNFFPPRA